MSHSVEFRRTAVQKFYSRGSRSVDEVASGLGVSPWSLYRWTKECGTPSVMEKKDRRPQDWSAAEKLNAVIEYERLAPEQQGEFLRREGLHTDHILAWKKSMEAGLESEIGGHTSRAELAQLKAEKKALERDLNQKDKALAEVTALLVLKKKADLIWGTGEKK